MSTQWIGNGYTAFPLEGMPLFDKESIYAMFDVTEKQQANICFTRSVLPEQINFGDIVPGEKIVKHGEMTMSVHNHELQPLWTRSGITFIDTAFLAPLADAAGTVALYERIADNGTTYIALKIGFMLSGIIFPCDPIDQAFVDALEDLWKGCRSTLAEKECHKQVGLQDVSPDQTCLA